MSEWPAPETAAAVPGCDPSLLWSTLREAIHGSKQDFTRAPIGRAVVLLSIPMVLEMLMESVFAVVDVFFVGRLGADAVATVGLTESLMTMVYALAMGLAIGATAVVARRVGEHDTHAAARAAVQAVILALVVAVVVGIVGVAFGESLLRAMGASDAVVHAGAPFVRIMLGTSGAVLLLFVINAVFRAAGDAAIAMRVLWFANAINIGLGPCLVFGLGPFPALGVTGAAIGTSVGRTAGVALQLIYLFGGERRLTIARSDLRVDWAGMRSIVQTSGTAVVQSLISTASWIGLVRILAGFGSAALAGNTIGIRIILFALLPAYGVANAAATLVGQNLGAGRPDRAEAAAWQAAWYNTLALGVVSLVFLLFAPELVGLFTTDPDVAAYGARCLRIVAAGFLFYGYGMVFTSAFNGAGDTRTPTLINLLCLWACELPLAWILAVPVGLGPTGVFIAVSVAFSLLALVSGWVFNKGTWKLRHV